MQDDFCSLETDCGEGLCCGKATAYDSRGYEVGMVHVCNDKTAIEWMDHLDWETYYTFECVGSGAIKVFASMTALATGLYIVL